MSQTIESIKTDIVTFGEFAKELYVLVTPNKKHVCTQIEPLPNVDNMLVNALAVFHDRKNAEYFMAKFDFVHAKIETIILEDAIKLAQEKQLQALALYVQDAVVNILYVN